MKRSQQGEFPDPAREFWYDALAWVLLVAVVVAFLCLV